jgi:hypothetical protein
MESRSSVETNSGLSLWYPDVDMAPISEFSKTMINNVGEVRYNGDK